MSEEKKENQNKNMHLEKEKNVPIGKLQKDQELLLHQLLQDNKDLFARSMNELQQTNVGEHSIITDNVHLIKRNAY